MHDATPDAGNDPITLGLIARLHAELTHQLRLVADKWVPKRLSEMKEERAQAAQVIDHLTKQLSDARLALKPFADCCEQIADNENDEEWAKFRLLVKDFRRARDFICESTQ